MEKQINNGWIPVSERMPESKLHEMSEEVIVTWTPRRNKNMKLVSTAVYIEEHSVTTDDMFWHSACYEDLEHSEVLASYWIPSGWYETITNTIDDVGYMPIDGEAVAWQPLPEPYKKER